MSYLRKYVPLKNGIPSMNTFQRVITRLEPEAFRECFLNWVDSYQQELGDVIAIDGKTLRRSFDKAGSRSPIHMISAFASKKGLFWLKRKSMRNPTILRQFRILLNMLDIKNSIFSIDTMVCPKKSPRELLIVTVIMLLH